MYWKNYLSPAALWVHLCRKTYVPHMRVGWFRAFHSIPLVDLVMFMSVSHGLNDYSFIIVLISIKHILLKVIPCEVQYESVLEMLEMGRN